MNFKPLFLLVALVFLVPISLYVVSAADLPQAIGGEQINQIKNYVSSNSSGGSSFDLTATHIFSGTNTFTYPLLASNLTVYSYSAMGNVTPAANRPLVIGPTPASSGNAFVDFHPTVSGSGGITIYESSGGGYLEIDEDGSHNFRMIDGMAGNIQLYSGGTGTANRVFDASTSVVTLGNNSTPYTIAIPGNTTLGNGASALKLVKTATSSLGFATALTIGQAQTNTITISGSLPGDSILAGWPSDLPSDSDWIMICTASNTSSVIRKALVSTSVYTNTFRSTLVQF